MKRILKLVLPPVLAIALVVGYGSGAMTTLARTITTMVTTVTACDEVIYNYPTAVGSGYTLVEEASEYYKYILPTDTVIETEVNVPDESEVSDKVVPDEEPHEVPQTPENNYGLFQDKIRNIIADVEKKTQTDSTVANPSSDPIVLDTGNWVSFKGDVYQKLQDSGRPIQITFRYKGKHYRVDIPAGADLMSLVDENGYCGFMNLMAHFGGTELER